MVLQQALPRNAVLHVEKTKELQDGIRSGGYRMNQRRIKYRFVHWAEICAYGRFGQRNPGTFQGGPSDRQWTLDLSNSTNLSIRIWSRQVYSTK